MVVSSFLLCDQLSERLEPSLFLCICRLLLIFHTIKLVVKICMMTSIFTARCYV